MLLMKKISVISAPESSLSLLFEWFNNNFMKGNSDKKHLIMNCKEVASAMIIGLSIESNKKVLLGTTIDYELKFDEHVNAEKKFKNSLHLILVHFYGC